MEERAAAAGWEEAAERREVRAAGRAERALAAAVDSGWESTVAVQEGRAAAAATGSGEAASTVLAMAMEAARRIRPAVREAEEAISARADSAAPVAATAAGSRCQSR